MREIGEREVGLTADVGWEIGVSGVLPHPIDEVWALLTGPGGAALWLGDAVDGFPDTGVRTTARDGTEVEVRSLRPDDRIRVVLRPAGWDHDTTAQVTVRASGPDRTVLRFHQEWLADADEREQQRLHWRAVLDRFRAELASD